MHPVQDIRLHANYLSTRTEKDKQNIYNPVVYPDPKTIHYVTSVKIFN